MYKCGWPAGCSEPWFDMMTVIDEAGQLDIPLCQAHHDLLTIALLELREIGLTEVTE